MAKKAKRELANRYGDNYKSSSKRYLIEKSARKHEKAQLKWFY